MLRKKIIVSFAVALASVSAVAAQAGDNPRQPGYFWADYKGAQVNGDGQRYVDSHNPRHPGFYVNGEWHAVTLSAPSVDTNNPLHPQHKKI
jgi:hypothetical protein